MKAWPPKKHIIFLLIVLLLAIVLRFWQLPEIPPGLYPDEAINGNDALATLRTNEFKVFYPDNNGREGLFVWLIAFSFRIFGAAPWSLRLVSALFGTLTVLGLYLLARELLNKKIAFWSSFFLAVSFWHTNFSRIGFRAILVPFLMCFSLYFLLRAFRTKNLRCFIAAGIIFGLGFYTYIAFRMAVLVLGFFLLMKFIESRQKQKWSRKDWLKIAIFFAAVTIIALPIGFHFLNHPYDFMGRASGVSIFAAENPIRELSLSAVKTLGMFNVRGDYNWRHNYSGAPVLNWLAGFLFLAGLAVAVQNIWVNRRRRESLFVFVWFLVMLLPAILTTEGIPHALRTIGAIPAIYIFAALGLERFSAQAARYHKKLPLCLIILCLLAPAISNFHHYFFKWAGHKETAKAFRQDLVQLGNYLNEIPSETAKYVIANGGGVLVPFPDGLPMPIQTVMFINRAPTAYLKHDELRKIAGPGIIIPLVDTTEVSEHLNSKWPNQISISWFNQFKVYEIQVER